MRMSIEKRVEQWRADFVVDWHVAAIDLACHQKVEETSALRHVIANYFFVPLIL